MTKLESWGLTDEYIAFLRKYPQLLEGIDIETIRYQFILLRISTGLTRFLTGINQGSAEFWEGQQQPIGSIWARWYKRRSS